MKSPTSIRNSVLSISMAILGLDYQRRQLRTSEGQRCVGTRHRWAHKSDGRFMQITSSSDSKLVSAQADGQVASKFTPWKWTKTS